MYVNIWYTIHQYHLWYTIYGIRYDLKDLHTLGATYTKKNSTFFLEFGKKSDLYETETRVLTQNSSFEKSDFFFRIGRAFQVCHLGSFIFSVLLEEEERGGGGVRSMKEKELSGSLNRDILTVVRHPSDFFIHPWFRSSRYLHKDFLEPNIFFF